MVYIEFYDKDVIENICSCLATVPTKVYILGDSKKLLKIHTQRYTKFFADRGTFIDFIPKNVNKNKLTDLVNVLSEIVENEKDCCFDLTGGKELYLVAMGIIFAKYPDKNLQMHRFNIKNNTIVDCDGDGNTISIIPAPKLTVKENISIYGGNIVFDNIKKDKTFNWDMTEEFKNDIESIWEICITSGVRKWNTQIEVFESAEKYHSDTESLTTSAPIDLLKEDLKRANAKYVYIPRIINKLSSYGLAYINENETALSITYKNEQIKKCLTKAGQALEMIVYLIALQLKDKYDCKIYNDVMTGVYIDWDGNIHRDGSYDTENEIDVLMMHNMIPIFVSCKNGVIDMDELYKLDSVANRFGGKYSKKVIVATSLDNRTFSEYFRQRAQDMNIRLIEPTKLTPEEFRKSIKNAWC